MCRRFPVPVVYDEKFTMCTQGKLCQFYTFTWKVDCTCKIFFISWYRKYASVLEGCIPGAEYTGHSFLVLCIMFVLQRRLASQTKYVLATHSHKQMLWNVHQGGPCVQQTLRGASWFRKSWRHKHAFATVPAVHGGRKGGSSSTSPKSAPNDIIYKVHNPHSRDSRYIYFFSDPPHLIKTVRNAWMNKKRPLWVCYNVVLVSAYMFIMYTFCLYNLHSVMGRRSVGNI